MTEIIQINNNPQKPYYGRYNAFGGGIRTLGYYRFIPATSAWTVNWNNSGATPNTTVGATVTAGANSNEYLFTGDWIDTVEFDNREIKLRFGDVVVGPSGYLRTFSTGSSDLVSIEGYQQIVGKNENGDTKVLWGVTYDILTNHEYAELGLNGALQLYEPADELDFIIRSYRVEVDITVTYAGAPPTGNNRHTVVSTGAGSTFNGLGFIVL